MTVGSHHTHLWKYALPLLLGNWMQLSYNAAEVIRYGSEYLAYMALFIYGLL
ncbi:MAG: hypothetical protein J6K03_02825 [Oscillospiraceae bacterium]|nr:hypothetical protein [Oscillospiraceae bacterium]